MTRLMLSLLCTGLASTLVAQEPRQIFSDGFENGLGAWRCRWPGKQPLVVTANKAFAGRKCAYSGPPGSMRVMEHAFRFPLTGRVEVRFFDDMAKGKQQTAMVGGAIEGKILALIIRDDQVYEYRVGGTYTRTNIPRKEGWRLFAWESDGASTKAFIDGVQVGQTTDVPTIHRLSLGSFWNDSTGWYDDAKAVAVPPKQATPFVEAEDIRGEDAPNGNGVDVVDKRGASGKAFKGWDAKGHALTWYLSTKSPGNYQLLLKHAGMGQAVRTGTWAGNPLRIEFPDTGGWDQWQYQASPVSLAKGVGELRLVNETGSRNLDWIALIPADAPAAEYGKLLDACRTGQERRKVAWAMTQRAAELAGMPAGEAPPATGEFRQLPPIGELRQLVEESAKGLAELRARVIEHEKPKLAAEFRVSPWTLDGPETELSRENYQRLVRYLHLMNPRFRDWPCLADCRYHKREGSAEWDVRQNATVALGYATILRGPYDETEGGVPRAKLETDLVQLLRTIAITHRANFLPTSDGKAWGDQWQSAFWAGIAGEAAWLCWERMPDDVRLLVARMVEHEANRFNARPPDSGHLLDTKAEENAWNSEVIALAACMFPNHRNNSLWQTRAKVYMINAFVRSADRDSERLVDGKPLREWISAVTLYDDYTLENHHRVHPDYLACSSLNLRNALLYKAAGLPLPESMSHGSRETYAVFKTLTATNGSCLYVNGQDWWPHRHDVPILLSAFSAVLHDDPEAAFLERANLNFFARMHARFKDGSAWDTREYNYANAEEEVIARYAEMYLLHRMFGDGPKPVSRDQFLASRAGTRIYERGGFVSHSTPTKYASFAWRNGVMGLVFVDDDTWLTAPYERGLVGNLVVKGKRDDTPKALRKEVRKLADGFAATAEVSRCQGTVRQWLAMVSLPGQPVVYLERLVAASDIEVERVRTAALGILNEDAPGINPNQRALYYSEGKRVVVGCSAAPPEEFALPGTWVNIDDRLGVVTSSGFHYQDENQYRHSRLREVLSARALDGVGAVAEGQSFGEAAVLILAGATANQTRAAAVQKESSGTVVGARLGDGTVILANLGGAPAAGRLLGVEYDLVALETRLVAHHP